MASPTKNIWTIPAHSKNKVNWAGEIIMKPQPLLDFKAESELDLAMEIVNNWRSSHSFPLNTIQNNLRRKAKTVCDDYIVAQRIKRLPSIKHKLDRFNTMKLSQIQDIGGCRAILPDIACVNSVCSSYDKGHSNHILHHKDDYIKLPKKSSYRGVHYVYRYSSEKNIAYNSLLIEIQIRTILQHSWATAVETAGIFIGEALKSSLGSKDWLEFFKLVSSGIALRENSTTVPDTPSDIPKLQEGISRHVQNLDIFNRLEKYRNALNVIEENPIRKNHFFIIELDLEKDKSLIKTFKKEQSIFAYEEYEKAEERTRENLASDVVLVSADSFEQLKKAYPNYFADTRLFMDITRDILKM